MKTSFFERASVAGTVIAVSVGAIASVLRGWIPLSDQALIELRVRDVPAHLPLVGVWSRYGWNHPGPSHFYYLSVFYWLGARSSTMLLVGSLLLHLLFVIASWWMIRRLDTGLGSLVLLGGVAILATSTPDSLRSPWNPYVVTVGGLALCCAAWSCAQRRQAGTILLPVTATFLVQAHLATAPMAIAVTLAAAVMFIFNRERESPRRALWIGVVLTALMWLPPLIQQFFGNPGNLVMILTERDSGPLFGVTRALKVASDALQLWPGVINPGTVESQILQGASWRFPLWGLLFVAAFIRAVKSRDVLLIRGATIATAAFLGSLLGIATLRGAAFSYLALSLRSSVVMMIVVSVGVAVQMEKRRPAVVAAVTLLLAVVVAFSQARTANPMAGSGRMITEFTDAVAAHDLPSQIEVQYLEPNLATMSAGPGLLLSLERAGYRVSAPTLGADLVGQWRAEAPAEYVVKIIPPAVTESFLADGWEVLDRYEPLTKAERAEQALVLVGRSEG